MVVEPAESAVLSGGVPGTHHIEGGGIGSWPPLLRPEDFDEVVTVPETDAFAMARQAAQTEGILSGRQRPEVPQRTASAGLQAVIELGCEGRDIWQREAIHRSDRNGPTETAGPEGAT